MNLRSLVVALALAGVIAPHAGAVDFNLVMPGQKGGGGQDVNAFLRTADEAHHLTSESAFVLSQALLAKEAAQDAQDRLQAAKAISDPKEREVAMAKVEHDVQAQLAKVDYEAKANEIAAANDKRKKALVNAAMYNFVLGVLKDRELVGRGQAVATSAAGNPMLIAQAGKVRDALALIGGQMGNMSQIVTGLQKLNSRLGSAPLPASSTATPVAVAD